MSEFLTRVEFNGSVKHRRGQQFVDGTGLAGDAYVRLHRIEPHGFASHPVKGGIGLAVSRGRRDTAYVLGGENPAMRPDLEQGGTAIYDHAGNIVSIVAAEMRLVHSGKVHIVAPEIVLEGTVRLGGPGADRPISAKDTVDTAGAADVDNFAVNVFGM